MNADGTNQTRLTETAQSEFDPAWSPDGTRIAYARGPNEDNTAIWVMNADASGQAQLTESGRFEPSWSPDSARLVLGFWNGRNVDLVVVNADGTGQTMLTRGPADDFDAAWSRPAP